VAAVPGKAGEVWEKAVKGESSLPRNGSAYAVMGMWKVPRSSRRDRQAARHGREGRPAAGEHGQVGMEVVRGRCQKGGLNRN